MCTENHTRNPKSLYIENLSLRQDCMLTRLTDRRYLGRPCSKNTNQPDQLAMCGDTIGYCMTELSRCCRGNCCRFLKPCTSAFRRRTMHCKNSMSHCRLRDTTVYCMTGSRHWYRGKKYHLLKRGSLRCMSVSRRRTTHCRNPTNRH